LAECHQSLNIFRLTEVKNSLIWCNTKRKLIKTTSFRVTTIKIASYARFPRASTLLMNAFTVVLKIKLRNKNSSSEKRLNFSPNQIKYHKPSHPFGQQSTRLKTTCQIKLFSHTSIGCLDFLRPYSASCPVFSIPVSQDTQDQITQHQSAV
jgi:hypothetical protein